MLHFPSTYLPANGLPNRSDSLKLNATQQKAPTHKIFLTVEEELHDARRVHSHGQEDDLRLALNMLIDRLSQISTMLSDAYKTNADLEVQLNVAKSNLTLITANNEMLEDALKQRDANTSQSVGWRRTSTRAYSTDDALRSASSPTLPPAAPTPTPVDSPAQESTRFFKFRFTPGSASNSRPGTPSASPMIPAAHLNSPSLPVLSVKDKEREQQLEKELEKERKAREEAKKEKEALESELESLSQALFEEFLLALFHALAIVVDVLITAGLTIMLWKRETLFASTRSLLQHIVIYAASRGILVTAAQVGHIIMYLVNSSNILFWYAFHPPLNKLYVISTRTFPSSLLYADEFNASLWPVIM
ncbi:hypothetical protein H0H92_003098 [Tricholoma furcatifolium]|nr:hypothetical protein H0H92_003098 [Tricholoma furcatifolium]